MVVHPLSLDRAGEWLPQIECASTRGTHGGLRPAYHVSVWMISLLRTMGGGGGQCLASLGNPLETAACMDPQAPTWPVPCARTGI